MKEKTKIVLKDIADILAYSVAIGVTGTGMIIMYKLFNGGALKIYEDNPFIAGVELAGCIGATAYFVYKFITDVKKRHKEFDRRKLYGG